MKAIDYWVSRDGNVKKFKDMNINYLNNVKGIVDRKISDLVAEISMELNLSAYNEKEPDTDYILDLEKEIKILGLIIKGIQKEINSRQTVSKVINNLFRGYNEKLS